MNDASVLRIYLARPMLDNARAGEVNILNRITAAFSARGYRTEFVQDSEAERLRALGRRGYALYHMHEPLTANTLCLRLSYLYPFWRIEDTNDRWDWDIAKATFDPETVDAGLANTFFDRRRHMLFKATPSVDQNFILVALQGRLLQHRGFQSMSPADMVREVIAREKRRDIVLRPHPKETLSGEERAFLQGLAQGSDRIRIVRRPLEQMLPRCSAVVTQNSSTALKAMFLKKPAVLFARSEFHHIAGSVPRDGIDKAFERIETAGDEDYARYLYWFFHTDMIDGASKDAEAQVLARVRRFGWDL